MISYAIWRTIALHRLPLLTILPIQYYELFTLSLWLELESHRSVSVLAHRGSVKLHIPITICHTEFDTISPYLNKTTCVHNALVSYQLKQKCELANRCCGGTICHTLLR